MNPHNSPSPPPHRNILRWRQVRARVPLSRPQVWRLEQAGKFPQRVQLTEAGAIGWFEDEIDAWCHTRIRAGGRRLTPRAASGSATEAADGVSMMFAEIDRDGDSATAAAMQQVAAG
jgi:prophage regulatory protein